MFYVYILLLRNNDLYKGFTNDLKNRIKEHDQGKVKATRNYRPISLVGYEGYLCKADAQRREKFLKTTEGRRLLKRQYRDVINLLKKRRGA
jgi:putative endonuclease